MAIVATGCRQSADQGESADPLDQPQVTGKSDPVKAPDPPTGPDLPRAPETPTRPEQPATVATSKPAPAEQAYEIHLQSGFDGKPVTVTVDGKQLYAGSPETDYTIGLAHTIQGVAPSGAIELLVEAPSKGVHSTLQIELSKGKLVGINVGKGKLDYRQANQFQYE